jgi:peroxiredoxin
MKNSSLFITFLFVLVVSLSNAQTTGYKVGDKARDFNLKNIDGKTVSLKDFNKSKGVVIVFTCNHCPVAVAYQDRIIALHNKYASKGYPVLAINSNNPEDNPIDNLEGMQTRAKEKGFPFKYVVDETQDIAKTYGANKTPYVFLLQKIGNDFLVKYIGAIDDNSGDATAVKEKYLENAINALLANKPVQVATTKAMGCGIKFKSI